MSASTLTDSMPPPETRFHSRAAWIARPRYWLRGRLHSTVLMLVNGAGVPGGRRSPAAEVGIPVSEARIMLH
jgi:hypothetical protein